MSSECKMKALVKKYDKPGIWMEEVPIPKIGINDVLIKIRKTSICGTDIHIYKWDEWAQKTIQTPMVIGHEFVGTIAATGDNVQSFKIGDLVSGEGHLVCGTCRNCLAGRRHLCMKTSGVGVNRPGAFAYHLAIPQTNVWYCDKSILEDLFSCFDLLEMQCTQLSLLMFLEKMFLLRALGLLVLWSRQLPGMRAQGMW